MNYLDSNMILGDHLANPLVLMGIFFAVAGMVVFAAVLLIQRVHDKRLESMSEETDFSLEKL